MSLFIGRQLLRIVDNPDGAGYFFVCIPGFDLTVAVLQNLKDLPPNVQPLIHCDKRLHAKVNLIDRDRLHIEFSDWEED